MNIGKLCISVTADSVGELIAKAERAAQIGDLVELRLDHLDRLDILKLSDLANKIPLIATFRCDSDEKRLAFWNSDKSPFWACDLEEDIIDKVPSCGRRIISYHHHQGVPADLTEIYERLSGYGADLIKIAATAVDATDAIPVWNLLERAKHDRRRLVAIAMGEAGTWTRILGPAHGSAITYASLDDGQKTAAGQITAHDSLDVYRVKEISGSTGVYGIIGDPVSHSLSPFMQNAAFAATGEDAVFVPFLVKDIDSFITRMVKRASRELELNFAGFSVTMPHKQAVIPHLDSIDPVAKAIGAVNTVHIGPDGMLTGFNTDAAGFITPLRKCLGSLNGARVAVIGSGGAARAAAYSLNQENAVITLFARDVKKAVVPGKNNEVKRISDLKFDVSNYDVLVNATPLGMEGPLQDETLLTADELSGVRLVYDLVTRPDGTPLMHAAAGAGIQVVGGLEMLIAQGARQFEIWTGRDAPAEVMRTAVLKRAGG